MHLWELPLTVADMRLGVVQIFFSKIL